MAHKKEFLQNRQHLPASKRAKKDEEIAINSNVEEIAMKNKVIAMKNEVITMKDKEIASKNEEISGLKRMLDEQKNQMGIEIAVLKSEIWRLKPNGKEMD